MGQSGHPAAFRVQVDVKASGLGSLLARRNTAVQQTGIEKLLQNGQALRVLGAKKLHILALGTLPVQLILQPAQYGGELGGIDRLENVFRHIHLNGLLGVLEVVKAGEHDKLGCWQLLRQNTA